MTTIDPDTLQCDQQEILYAMAHAALQLVDASGQVVQTETGWGDGEGAVDRGSWATRTAITLFVDCGSEPPPSTNGQETALMFGSIVLNDDTDEYCMSFVDTDKPKDGEPDTWVDSFDAQRWGWQEGPLGESIEDYSFPVWAAAGGNDTEKGTLVGYVNINVYNGTVTVTPDLFAGFTALETHIYIGAVPVCSGAFGNDWTSNASTQIDTVDGVYVAVHFSIEAECQANGNFCEPLD